MEPKITPKQENIPSFNPDYADTIEQIRDAGVKAVEYFIRTGTANSVFF